jgi:hypothetical protein
MLRNLRDDCGPSARLGFYIVSPTFLTSDLYLSVGQGDCRRSQTKDEHNRVSERCRKMPRAALGFSLKNVLRRVLHWAACCGVAKRRRHPVRGPRPGREDSLAVAARSRGSICRPAGIDVAGPTPPVFGRPRARGEQRQPQRQLSKNMLVIRSVRWPESVTCLIGDDHFSTPAQCI